MIKYDDRIFDTYPLVRGNQMKEVHVIWKSDLKPIVQEDVVAAMLFKPQVLIVNPKNADRVAKMVKPYGDVAVMTDRSIAPCELRYGALLSFDEMNMERDRLTRDADEFRRWILEATSDGTTDDEGNIIPKRRTHARNTLPVYVKDVQKLLRDNPTWDSKEVVKYYKKNKKLYMTKAQVDRMINGQAQRGYVRAKVMKGK